MEFETCINIIPIHVGFKEISKSKQRSTIATICESGNSASLLIISVDCIFTLFNYLLPVVSPDMPPSIKQQQDAYWEQVDRLQRCVDRLRKLDATVRRNDAQLDRLQDEREEALRRGTKHKSGM